MGMEAPVPQDDKQRPNERTFVFRAPEEADSRPKPEQLPKDNMQPRTILITGGAGFIGSHLTRLFVKKYPHYRIVNLDALTYAGVRENLDGLDRK